MKFKDLRHGAKFIPKQDIDNEFKNNHKREPFFEVFLKLKFPARMEPPAEHHHGQLCTAVVLNTGFLHVFPNDAEVVRIRS